MAKKIIDKAPRNTAKTVSETQQKLKSKRWTALGSIIIFLSWASQNYFQEQWHSEVVRIERNKLAIGFNEVNKNIYQTFLNSEESKSLQDSNYDGSLLLAYHAYSLYSNLLQYLGTTLTSDDKDFLNENESIFKANIDDITKWANSGQLENLRSFAQRLSRWESKNGMNTVGSYQTLLFEKRKKEERWNNIYLVLYIFGAICLGYAFLIDYKLIQTEK